MTFTISKDTKNSAAFADGITILFDEDGETLRKRGGEFGATTGRPRRCGWFDAVVARYAQRVNGVDFWAMTKLDVLDTFPVVKICTGYRRDDGFVYQTFPADHVRLQLRP